MTEIYKNGKAKKTESEKSKNKESGCTPDKNYAKADKELRAERKEKGKLEKELARKEKALAEAAALLVLRKKADAIWGTDEEDE